MIKYGTLSQREKKIHFVLASKNVFLYPFVVKNVRVLVGCAQAYSPRR